MEREVVINQHTVTVWNFSQQLWEEYRPWMRWCPSLVVRINGRIVRSAEDYELLRR